MIAPASKRPPEPPSTPERWGGPVAWSVLALVCAASILVLTILGTRLTFFNDDWYFLLQRPGLEGSSVLSPHNGQLVVGVDLSYKALVALWGFDQLPFRLLLSAAVSAVGVVVYLLVAERIGPLLGIVAATLIVFLGPAWEALLFYASIGPVAALAAGLAALLLLQRDTPRRNAAACALLAFSVALSGVGIAFVAAAVVAVAIRRRPTQLWIPAAPVAIWAAWSLAWGDDSTAEVSLSNVEHLPRYILDSASFGLASLTGLNQGPSAELQAHLLLAVSTFAIVLWLVRGGRPSPQLAVFAAAALAFWTLTGLGFVTGREAFASRYQIVSAALLVVIAAELLRPFRPNRWQSALVIVVAALALVSNLERLDEGYRYLSARSSAAKADIGALEIARGRTGGDLRLTTPVAYDDYLAGITTDRYYEETYDHGPMSHYSPQQIAEAHPVLRRAADSVLAAAYALELAPAEPPGAADRCRRLPTGPEAELPPGGASVRNLGTRPVELGVRRFGPLGAYLYLGRLAPESAGTVTLPRDDAGRPWLLAAEGDAPLLICSARVMP